MKLLKLDRCWRLGGIVEQNTVDMLYFVYDAVCCGGNGFGGQQGNFRGHKVGRGHSAQGDGVIIGAFITHNTNAAHVGQRPSQYFAALTNMRSVGVMGDERTYDYAIALRAVTTTDFMTAEVTLLPTETITTAANRIVNEVKHINRVLFDYTTKPPATIEFE